MWQGEPMPDVLERVGEYWDLDAATYDRSASHRPRNERELGAWSATLRELLPPLPAKVLDVGAGTGFLSLLAARLGYDVVALDLSNGMLEQLRAKVGEEGLTVTTAQGPSHEPPSGPFDAVIERHVTWTLPDPVASLAAWRAAAPQGRLVLFESCWGVAASPRERQLARARSLLARARRTPPHHHAEYESDLRDSLPMGRGTPPEAVRAIATAAGWPSPQVRWLTEIDRAARKERPLPDRLLGVTPRFAIVAG
jgi:SAM-dependent methyltransferase